MGNATGIRGAQLQGIVSFGFSRTAAAYSRLTRAYSLSLTITNTGTATASGGFQVTLAAWMSGDSRRPRPCWCRA